MTRRLVLLAPTGDSDISALPGSARNLQKMTITSKTDLLVTKVLGFVPLADEKWERGTEIVIHSCRNRF